MAVMMLVVLGCVPPSAGPRAPGPARYTKLNEAPRPTPARAPWSVTIYQVRIPAEPFVEIGRLADLGQDESVALEALRSSAGHLGCDGLIIGGALVESIIAGSVQQVSVPGTCIMFVRDPGTWRPPEPEPAVQQPAQNPAPAASDVCVQSRARILAAKNPRERARLISSMPSECHPR
jgi:hypothetical protein